MPLKFSEGLLSGLRNYGRMPEPDPSIVRRPGGMLTPAPQYAPAQTIAKGIGGMFGVDMRTDEQKRAEGVRALPQTPEGLIQAIDVQMQDPNLSVADRTKLRTNRLTIQNQIAAAKLREEEAKAKNLEAVREDMVFDTMATTLRKLDPAYEGIAKNIENNVYSYSDASDLVSQLQKDHATLSSDSGKLLTTRQAFLKSKGLGVEDLGMTVEEVRDADSAHLTILIDDALAKKERDNLAVEMRKKDRDDLANDLESGLLTVAHARSEYLKDPDPEKEPKYLQHTLTEDYYVPPHAYNGEIIRGGTRRVAKVTPVAGDEFMGYWLDDRPDPVWVVLPRGSKKLSGGELTATESARARVYVEGNPNEDYEALPGKEDKPGPARSMFIADVARRAQEIANERGQSFEKSLGEARAEALTRISRPDLKDPWYQVGPFSSDATYTSMDEVGAKGKKTDAEKEANAKIGDVITVKGRRFKLTKDGWDEVTK